MRALRKAEEEEKLRERPTTGYNLLIHLREVFFDTNVGSRPSFARMCG